jgi:hypothetical protein
MKRFSIRDLLFAVAIIALAFGWWFDRTPAPARFQMVNGSGHAFVLDTAAGQVWSQNYDPNFHSSDDGNIHGAKLPN